MLQLRVALARDAAGATTQRVALWVRAVEIGCFGDGRVRAHSLLTQGNLLQAEWHCERLSSDAIDALARLLRHLASTQASLEGVELLLDGRAVTPRPDITPPELADAPPFELAYPADLKRFVRAEIEFRAALAPTARDAVFDALAVWDGLVAAFGDTERWGDRVDLETRLLSPRIVEHQVDGYFASFECLYPLVRLVLRLHRKLPIERLTLE